MPTDAAANALIFTDVDNTLVFHDLEARTRGEEIPRFDRVAPSPAVYRAFERLRARGHKVYLCTGRALCNIPRLLHDLNPDGIIAEAGAYVRSGDRVLCDAHMSLDVLERAASLLEELVVDVEFEGNEGLIEFYPSGAQGAFPEFSIARGVDDFMELAARYPIAKFCIHGASTKRLTSFIAFAREYFEICDLAGDVLEFSLHGTDKGSAIRLVREHLGRGIEGTYAFGDSENDLPMAAEVETFIAMGNALEHVKQQADLVAPPVKDDGMPRMAAKLGLIDCFE